MNQTFSFSRWSKLTAKHWAENLRKYLLGSLALAGIMVAWYTVVIIANDYRPIHEMMQMITYCFGLFLVGCLFGSMVFSDVNNRARGIDFISLPASHFEKLLLAFFNGLVVFFVVYTATYYLVTWAMVELAQSIFHSRFPQGVDSTRGLVNLFTITEDANNEVNPMKILLLIFVAVQAAYILGSIYFGAYSFIKTTVGLFAVSLIIMLFFGKVLSSTLPQGTNYWSLTSLKIDDPAGAKMVSLPKWIGTAFEFFLLYAFAPLFYVVAYFRLKEKEI